jgi:LuxR family maltose regulon positive regulatory protein
MPVAAAGLRRTKLYPPRLAADLIVRPRLLKELRRGLDGPLTLVSAPAGFGKSTLVANWLHREKRDFGWVSLAEEDSDPRVFWTCVVAALRNAVPDTCPATTRLLLEPELRPHAIVDALSDEIDELPDGMPLVLDDYHLIRDTVVQDMMAELLDRPPSNLVLTLIARRDPPLPLATLRAAGHLVEIRQQDLQFSAVETMAFFGQATGLSLEEATLERLTHTTEGWAVGLRLAALLVHGGEDPDRLLSGVDGTFAELSDYLVGEVLNRQEPEHQRWMFATSILDRFSDSLSEAVASPETSEGSMTGAEFMSWVASSDLFVVSLDTNRQWFRYHHLFRTLLLQQLEARRGVEHVSQLHRRAAAWHQSNGSAEEAVHHFLAAGVPGGAAEVIRQERHTLTRSEQWSRLDRLVSRLPAATLADDLDLLVARAFIAENRFRYSEAIELIAQIETLASPSRPEPTPALLGEIEALRSFRCYLCCEGAAAVQASRKALESIPAEHLSERGFALAINVMSLQMAEGVQEAETVAFEALQDRSLRGSTSHTRVLLGLCMAHCMEGNTTRVLRLGEELLKLGEGFDLVESTAFARYLLGLAHFERDDLERAEKILAPTTRRGARPDVTNYVYSSFLLALTQLRRGKHDEALEVAGQVAAAALELHNPEILTITEAFEAELALRQGRTAEALAWAEIFEPTLVAPRYRFFIPELTLIRVLLTEASPANLTRASALIDTLLANLTAINHRRSVIELLALRAILEDRCGDRAAALASLSRAVEEAASKMLLRPLLDLGHPLEGLLADLLPSAAAGPFLATILERLESETAQPAADLLASRNQSPVSHQIEPLSLREEQVLELLTKRLSNQEIASGLGIAPGTVKRHLSNIFEKLQVHKRRDAVARARSLGLVGS